MLSCLLKMIECVVSVGTLFVMQLPKFVVRVRWLKGPPNPCRVFIDMDLSKVAG